MEPSSERLGQALRDAGYHELAARAYRDEFHDFRSPHTFPLIELCAELRKTGSRTSAEGLIARIQGGDFDASVEESDRWMASAEGQAALRQVFEEDR